MDTAAVQLEAWEAMMPPIPFTDQQWQAIYKAHSAAIAELEGQGLSAAAVVWVCALQLVGLARMRKSRIEPVFAELAGACAAIWQRSDPSTLPPKGKA